MNVRTLVLRDADQIPEQRAARCKVATSSFVHTDPFPNTEKRLRAAQDITCETAGIATGSERCHPTIPLTGAEVVATLAAMSPRRSHHEM